MEEKIADNELIWFIKEHESIRQARGNFDQKEISSVAVYFNEKGEFPSKAIIKLSEMGFMGIEVPEEYRGVGAGLAQTLVKRTHQVRVVDTNPDAFERFGPSFRGKTILGIGFDRDTLIQAGIERADGLAAVTSSRRDIGSGTFC